MKKKKVLNSLQKHFGKTISEQEFKTVINEQSSVFDKEIDSVKKSIGSVKASQKGIGSTIEHISNSIKKEIDSVKGSLESVYSEIDTKVDGLNVQVKRDLIDVVDNLKHKDLKDIGPDDHHSEKHTIDSHDTNATGEQLNQLVDGGNADELHTHTFPYYAGGGGGGGITFKISEGDHTSSYFQNKVKAGVGITFTKTTDSGTGAETITIKTDGSYLDTEYLRLDGTNGPQNSIPFDTSGTPPNEDEGQVWWNNTDKTLNLSTGVGPVLQVGQENYLPYTLGLNDSGSTIDDGSVVYLSDNGSVITIELANSRDPDIQGRVVGITTESISDGETGLVTTYGKVRGLDTSGYSLGDLLYVSPTVDGGLTATRPTGGDFVICLATVTEVDNSDGEIFVRYLDIRDPDDIKNATGFPNQNALVKQSDASFTNANRTFTLEPNSGGGYSSFYIWQLGIKYLFDSAQTVQIPDEEGIYYVYFNLGTMTYVKNPTVSQTEDLIRTKVLVAIIYWNATDNEAVIIGDERHGHVMSSDTHAYLHFSVGAQWLNGLALTNVSADQTGALDSHAQFGVNSGVVTDEDLINIVSAVTSTTGLPIFYLDGADANLRRISESGFSVLTDTTAGLGSPTGRLVWNEFTGGSWQLTTVANTDFVLCHVFGTNSKQDPVIAFVGQGDYGNVAAARAGAETEITTILTNYPGPELVPLATVIFQTRNTYGNSVLARVRTTDEGDDYVDWRQSELQPGAAPSAHPNLATLNWADAGHTLDADFVPDTDASYDLGSLTYQWKDLFLSGDIAAGGSATFGGGTSGQSIIQKGLVVNEGGTGEATDDFRVETLNEANAFVVDASGDSISVGVEATFSVFPITPSAAPDADYEVANKKYVDDEISGIDLSPYFNKSTDDSDDINEGASNLFNQTHTGEVTGSVGLTVDKTAITGKGVVTIDNADYLLVSDTSDSGNLKKGLVSDISTDISGKADTDLNNLVATSVNQDLDPSTNGARDIGNSSKRWKDIWLSNDIRSSGGDMVLGNGSSTGNSIAFGKSAYISSGDISSLNIGVMTHGSITGSGDYSYGYIYCGGPGTESSGYIYSYSYEGEAYNYAYGKIYAEGYGSKAFGRIYSYAYSSYITVNAYIKSTGAGALSFGYVSASDEGTSQILASGNGSFAGGYANNLRNVIASGVASIAFGSTSSASVLASARNSVQFGPGTNAQAESLQVGSQIRIKGTAGAPSSNLHNGDIWVNNNYVYIRSNGVSCKVVNNPL